MVTSIFPCLFPSPVCSLRPPSLQPEASLPLLKPVSSCSVGPYWHLQLPSCIQLTYIPLTLTVHVHLQKSIHMLFLSVTLPSFSVFRTVAFLSIDIWFVLRLNDTKYGSWCIQLPPSILYLTFWEFSASHHVISGIHSMTLWHRLL